MKRTNLLRVAALAGIAGIIALIGTTMGACNDQGDCPAKESIVAGGACSGEELQCAYDLATPSAACDGTKTTLSTSCICTSGVWACPSAFACETDAAAETGDDGGAETGDDGSAETGDDGGTETGDDSGGEAGGDAGATDARHG